jgi:pimeloyl-ACP methyl ester carboxylesterase
VRATNRPVPAAFLAVLTILAAVAPPAVAARRDAGITWTHCADDETAQCGDLSVPIDWADPYSPRITVAVARRPATDPAHRIGTLIVNPGGPGGSGVDFAIGAASFFSAKLRARFDIVGFDPRGVGRSSPVTCARSLVDSAPEALITSKAAYAAMVAYNRRLAADCRTRTGPLFGHVDTLSVVRDMDALRAALGAARVTFYGASYGTLLGAQYADRYPGRVRAVVLDSVLDHSATVDEFLGIESAAAQDAFAEFVAWCARDTTCAVRGRDIPALWSSLLARAAAGRLADPYAPGRKVTVSALVQVAFSSFYDPQWYALGFYLKEASAPPVARRPPRVPGFSAPPVARRPPRVPGFSAPPAARRPPRVPGFSAPPAARRPPRVPGFSAPSEGPGAGSNTAVFCADWSLPVTGYADLSRKLAAARARAPQMLASPLALQATVGCLGWPVPPVNPQHTLRPATTPVLLINARHDPATAYTWAQRVAAQLGSRAHLVTYEGWGHVVYSRTTCVDDIVDAFLLDGRTPAAGASCPGVPPDPYGVGGV